MKRLDPYKGKEADDNADWLKRVRNGYYQKRDLAAHEAAEREERKRREWEEELKRMEAEEEEKRERWLADMKDYASWLEKVNQLALRSGISDLPHWRWREAYNSGAGPDEAWRDALAEDILE